MANFETFRVLLDDPAAAPALGYGEYARAFSEVIRHSEPQFAIGIFGDWGSGKTTLMRAIERDLQRHKDVVGVWFNAWRYEREPDLIVPLLDTLRERLGEWAEHRRSKDERDRARRAAAAIGRAAQALVRGTTIKAAIPALNVEIDPARVLDAWSSAEVPTAALSFYHASFNAMRDAVADFFETTEGGDAVRRVVVFVDDLDRCLPNSALQVLESMKLFFDLNGFIFVVGLDREVIERSIEAKYGAVRDDADGDGRELPEREPERRAINGADYVKKIFQVPFGLPRISADDLEPFFRTLADRPDLPGEQRTDLWSVVWPHISASTAGSSVNPREVKRLVNAYTLQMKMLTVKLKPRKAAPDPNVVLALQAFAFRADWERFYELLTADPQLFVEALRPVIDDQTGTVEFSLTAEPLPRSLIDYVRTTGARALLDADNLDVYVTTAEATRSSDPAVLEAQTVVAQVRRVLAELGRPGSGVTEVAAVSELHDKLSIVQSMLTRRSTPLASEAMARSKALTDDVKARVPSPSPDAPQQVPEWANRAKRLLTALEETLGAMRRETFVGSASA